MAQRNRLPPKEEVERLIDGGLTQGEIGERYGASPKVVFERLHEKHCIDCGQIIGRASSGRCRLCNLRIMRERVTKGIHKKTVWCACEVCGRKFSVMGSRYKRSIPRFCSTECRRGQKLNRARYKRTSRECLYCGVEFSGQPSVIKAQAFCSARCSLIYRKHQRLSQRINGRHCECCGRNFALSALRLNMLKNHSSYGRFCCLGCFREWNKGDNSYRWSGGNQSKYPDDFYLKRKIIIERDNEHCAICHLPGAEVHHISYDKQNCTEENLILLCESCHGATGWNRDYWQPALSILAEAREFRRQIIIAGMIFYGNNNCDCNCLSA